MSRLDLICGRGFRALLAGLASVLAGCASAQPAAPTRADPNPAALAPDVAATVLGSAGYEDDGRTLFAGSQVLIGRCMARRGFSYRKGIVLPAYPTVAMPRSTGGYGLFDRFATRRSGGRRDRRGDHARQRDPDVLDRVRRAAYKRALYGSARRTATVPGLGGPSVTYRTAGCYAQAMRAIHGELSAYERRLMRQNAVASQVADLVVSDAPFTDSVEGWRLCMARRGFPVPSPEHARDGLFDAYVNAARLARVHARELVTAGADRACAMATGMYRERARAERIALAHIPKRDAAAMVHVARARSAATRRARAILAVGDH